MAYETLLNVTPVLATSASTVNAAGYTANLLLNINNTTLGNFLSDDVAYLIVGASPAAGGVTLSATSTTSIYLTLSSASVIPTTINYYGNIATSTYSATSATLTLNFPVANSTVNVNLPTTSISLSANSANTVIDPTKTSTLDNFFFASTNPAENTNNAPNAVRTTAGHSRITAALG